MKKVGIKKVSLVKILNIIDIINTAIERLITILVPGWLSLKILDQSKYLFFIFILFGIFVKKKQKKLESKRFL